MPSLAITSQQRSALRAAAHRLRPVVLIGDQGLTDGVLKEIDRALSAHGLVKVRAGGQEREDREAMLQAICDTLSCAAVHHLGKILILYRPTPEQARQARAAERPAGRRAAGQPHTPKKMAAEGKTLAKPARRTRRKAASATGQAPATKPARAASQPAARKAGKSAGAAKRAGSALTLRAGARPGTARRKAGAGTQAARRAKK